MHLEEEVMQVFAPEGNPDLRSRPGVFVDNPVNAPTQFRGGLAPRVVRHLREHIDSNIERRIKVETLANLANLSVCYFVRAFKRSMGVTPHDYLMRQRVERTVQLLSDTNMSLSEIAFAAGFADQSQFARRFRQHVGVSPRDYRRARV
jgi:transcriptional regulator GlxA family with amidase domain